MSEDLRTSVRQLWYMHTWGGRLSIIYYWLRGLFIEPAPDGRRCFMGAPVSDEVHCPRWTDAGALWCRVHACGWTKHSDGRPCPEAKGHAPYSLLVEHHIDCYGRRPE